MFRLNVELNYQILPQFSANEQKPSIFFTIDKTAKICVFFACFEGFYDQMLVPSLPLLLLWMEFLGTMWLHFPACFEIACKLWHNFDDKKNYLLRQSTYIHYSKMAVASQLLRTGFSSTKCVKYTRESTICSKWKDTFNVLCPPYFFSLFIWWMS